MAITSVAVARMTPRLIDRPAADTTIPSELSRKRTGTTLVGRTVEVLLAGEHSHALPGGKGHQERADEVQAVQRRARDVCTRGDLQYKNAVGCREENKSGAQCPPRAVRGAASDGEDRNDHGHEDHVADRIRDVRGDACAADPSARLDDRSDHQDELERGHPESGDQTIDPDGLRRMRDGLAPRRPMPGNANTKNVRKAASDIEGYG